MDSDQIQDLRRRALQERMAASRAPTSALEDTYLSLAESYERLADAHERLLVLKGGA